MFILKRTSCLLVEDLLCFGEVFPPKVLWTLPEYVVPWTPRSPRRLKGSSSSQRGFSSRALIQNTQPNKVKNGSINTESSISRDLPSLNVTENQRLSWQEKSRRENPQPWRIWRVSAHSAFSSLTGHYGRKLTAESKWLTILKKGKCASYCDTKTHFRINS